jgi:hypothetical protein
MFGMRDPLLEMVSHCTLGVAAARCGVMLAGVYSVVRAGFIRLIVASSDAVRAPAVRHGRCRFCVTRAKTVFVVSLTSLTEWMLIQGKIKEGSNPARVTPGQTRVNKPACGLHATHRDGYHTPCGCLSVVSLPLGRGRAPQESPAMGRRWKGSTARQGGAWQQDQVGVLESGVEARFAGGLRHPRISAVHREAGELQPRASAARGAGGWPRISPSSCSDDPQRYAVAPALLLGDGGCVWPSKILVLM